MILFTDQEKGITRVFADSVDMNHTAAVDQELLNDILSLGNGNKNLTVHIMDDGDYADMRVCSRDKGTWGNYRLVESHSAKAVACERIVLDHAIHL